MRLKKLFLPILAMLATVPAALGADNYVTFKVTGVTDAAKYISFYDINAEEQLEITGQEVIFNYTEPYGMLSIGMSADNITDGYNFEIAFDDASIAQSMGTYVIQDGPSAEGSKEYVVAAFPAVSGKSFTITVTGPTETPTPPAPEKSSITFKFAGVADGYKTITILDTFSYEELNITGAPLTVDYTPGKAQFCISQTIEDADEGYSFTLTCDKEAGDPSSNPNYVIQEIGLDAPQVMLDLYAGANGAVFTINVEKYVEEPENGAKMYMNVSTAPSLLAVVPTDNDAVFEYNAEEQVYTLKVENMAMKNAENKNLYYRFYLKDEDGNITGWNVVSSSNVKFAVGQGATQVYEIEKNRVSPIFITRFANDVETADVLITIKTDTGADDENNATLGQLVLTQIVDDNSYPEKIYLWGSTQGGYNTHVCAEMLPLEDKPYIYTTIYDVPVTVFDPSASFGGSMAFTFFLGTNGSDYKKGTIFLGYYPAHGDVADPSHITVNLKPGDVFTTILRSTTLDASNLICYTPGTMEMTFNLLTQELTIKMISGLNHATLIFEGNPDEAFEKYLTVEVNDKEYPIEINPQVLWYAGDLDMTLTPATDVEFTVECTTETAEPVISETDGVYTLKSSQNGLGFIVTFTKLPEDEDNGDNGDNGENEDSGVVSVGADDAEAVYFDLQGRRVVNPDRGVYVKVVNGKAVKEIRN